jgi:hypothetical protein
MQFASMKRLLSKHGGYWTTINGIRHVNDEPLFSPWWYGRIVRPAFSEIIRQYTMTFFDVSLKGIEQPILESLSPAVSEVRFPGMGAGGHGLIRFRMLRYERRR